MTTPKTQATRVAAVVTRELAFNLDALGDAGTMEAQAAVIRAMARRFRDAAQTLDEAARLADRIAEVRACQRERCERGAA